MADLNEMGKRAKIASKELARLQPQNKNEILSACADAILINKKMIIEENIKDVAAAREKGTKESLIDRLFLDEKRIEAIASALKKIAELEDPVGQVLQMKKLNNGLLVGQKRVPMGVIGIIYESRPNVTCDTFSLCLKAGSSVILKGGSDAIHSNTAFVQLFREVLNKMCYNPDFVSLIADTDRKTTEEFMKLNQYLDLLIPRGGANLIKSVVENSTVPVIETGTGNCHVFVDQSADFKKAVDIILNGKVQRPGVCNSTEKLLVHKGVKEDFIPLIINSLIDHGVTIYGDETVCAMDQRAHILSEEDWYTEYLDYTIAIKIVADIEEAICHIEQYSSGHSEVIITNDYNNTQKFLNEVDSAAVYVNASTRFTDGYEFGLGAEIGISTQKLHARGPMGLKEITTTKYIIYGDGQIRE